MALESSAPISLHRSPTDLHPALEAVRQMKEFAPPEPGPLERLMAQPWIQSMTQKWQAVFQHLLDNLRQGFSHFSPTGEDLPPYLIDIISTAAGLLLVLLAVFAFYLMLSSLRRLLSRPGMHHPETARVVDGALLVSSAHHRAEANRLGQAGQLDAAVRELYLAMLCLLEEQGILRFEATRSNADYQYTLHHHPALLQSFSEIAGAFESSRYGARHIDAGHYQTCEVRYQQASESITYRNNSHG